MFSTLLLSFACAAPAQEPVAPLVDSFPANSLITVELSLEPWDRLRKQTSAHALFHDRNILKKAIAIASPLGDENATNEMRAALGSVRFVLAVTPESLGLGGLLLAVEPINFGASAYDWATHLQKLTGVPAQKLGNGFVTMLHAPDAFEVDSATEYLSKIGKAATSGEGTLGMHQDWKPLHRTQLTGDDLLRVTLPGWNWNQQSMLPIANMIDSGQTGMLSSMFAVMVDFMGIKHGLSIKTSILGSEIVDRYFLPRPEGSASMLVSVGKKKEAFARFEALPAGEGTIFLQGIDLTHAVMLSRATFTSIMGQFGMAIEDEPIAVQAFEALQACAVQLGPESTSFTSFESMQDSQMGTMRVAVRDRTALESAWQTMPEEIKSFLPVIAAQASVGIGALTLEDRWLVLSSSSMPEGAKPLSASPEYLAIREHALEYVKQGEDVLSISFAPAGFAAVVWEMANEALIDLGDQFGFKYQLGPIRPDDRKALGSTWSVVKRTARGIEGEAHSSFGSLMFGSFAAIKAAMDAQNAGTITEFDEDEF
jgi:hypothetical protein